MRGPDLPDGKPGQATPVLRAGQTIESGEISHEQRAAIVVAYPGMPGRTCLIACRSAGALRDSELDAARAAILREPVVPPGVIPIMIGTSKVDVHRGGLPAE